MARKQQMNLRLDELTRAAIERIAADYNMSKTQVVMRAVMLLDRELSSSAKSANGTNERYRPPPGEGYTEH